MLLDIEGTTTPISFVHEVLFPYARLHLSTYLQRHFDSPEVLADLARLSEEHKVEVNEGQQGLQAVIHANRFGLTEILGYAQSRLCLCA